MSEIRLNTSNDLVTFLKILAEESVRSAQSEISKDPMQKIMSRKIAADEKVYGSLDEEDPVETEDDPTTSEEPASDESPREPMSRDTLEVSLDSIFDAVNDLRSGRSLKDRQIKQQLRMYFDRLDTLERESMLAFFRAFAGILTGQFDGSAAPDPSEEPYSITMSKGDDESKQQAPGPETLPDAPDPESPAPEEDEEQEDDLEDTSPPIQAGQEQQLAEIRKRVRKLMSM